LQLLVPPRLIVVAYAVAPGPGGPESQVNLELLRALAAHWPSGVTVISGGGPPAMSIPPGWRVHALGEHGPSALAGAAVRGLRRGALPVRAVEKLVHLRTGQGIKMLSWQRAASRILEFELDRDPDAVVWSRALPFASIGAVAAVRRPLRWIVNVNDPMPPGVWPNLYAFDPHADRRTRERFAAAIPRISALTFPSSRLRDLELAAFPELAKAPSEVLPHIARERKNGGPPPSRKLRIAFGGTLRKDRARPELAEVLALLPAICQDLEISFHLARPTPFAEGYAAGLPARIVLEEDEEALARSLAEADVLLDLECEADRPLLLTKVVNYLAAGRPIWSLCAPESTARDLVEEGWGYASPLGDPAAVAETLARIHGDWSRGDLEARVPSAALRERFSAKRQVELLLGLLERMV
jgi:glycosyltransferase involved in cell wall biosynthesis